MSENKEKKLFSKKLPAKVKKLLILIGAFILFAIATNPSVLFFLSADSKGKLRDMWSSFFGGDVSAITKTVSVNWITLFKLIGVILLLVIINDLAKLILEWWKPKSSKAKSIHSMISSFLFYGILLIGIIWCLSAIGINLSTIFASIGIVALIIGFAAESLIEDVITGLFLVFEDEFNVGDIIELSDFRGTVTSIGVRCTCIQDAGGNVKVVNNSDIRNILNRSKSKSFASVIVPISYDANLEKTEKVLEDILKDIQSKYPDVFAEPLVYAGVQELGASSIDLKVLAHVEEKDIFKAPRLINREIKIAFDKKHIEIPYQQIVIHNAEK